MGRLEGRPKASCGCVAGQSDRPLAQSSECDGLAVWERRTTSGGRRADVPGHSRKTGMAESVNLFGFGNADEGHGHFRREDDWSVRIRAAGLLASGHAGRWGLRVQHGDEPWAGDSDAAIPG